MQHSISKSTSTLTYINMWGIRKNKHSIKENEKREEKNFLLNNVNLLYFQITYRTTFAFIDGHQRSKQQKPQRITTNHFSFCRKFYFPLKNNLEKENIFYSQKQLWNFSCCCCCFFGLWYCFCITINTNSHKETFFFCRISNKNYLLFIILLLATGKTKICLTNKNTVFLR